MKFQKGFTLIEIMFVIAIIGMATILVVQDVAATGTARQVAFQLEEIKDIVRKVNLLKDATSNYATLSSAYLATRKIVPDRYLNAAGNNIKSPFGGAVIVSQWGANGYSIEIASVPQDVCMDVVSGIESDTVTWLYARSAGALYVLQPGSTGKNYANACNHATANRIILYITVS